MTNASLCGEGLSHVAQSQATLVQHRLQPFHRLERAFLAQGKSPVMDGEEKLSSRPVGHPQSLFRGAMRADPWLVGANRHDSQLKGTAWPKPAKTIAPGRVSAEDDFFSFAVQNITVVTAISISFPTGTPMLDFKSFQPHFAVGGAQPGLIIPAQLGHIAEPGPPDNVARGPRRDHLGRAGQAF